MEDNKKEDNRNNERKEERKVFPPLEDTKFAFRYSLFICHRGQTKGISIALYQHLKEMGYKSFIDAFSFYPGSDVNSTLSDLVLPRVHFGAVILLSTRFFESGWCWNEFLLLVARKKRDPSFKLWYFWCPNDSEYVSDNVAELSQEGLMDRSLNEFRPEEVWMRDT